MVLLHKDDIGKRDRGKKILRVDRNTVILVDPAKVSTKEDEEKLIRRYRRDYETE